MGLLSQVSGESSPESFQSYDCLFSRLILFIFFPFLFNKVYFRQTIVHFGQITRKFRMKNGQRQLNEKSVMPAGQLGVALCGDGADRSVQSRERERNVGSPAAPQAHKLRCLSPALSFSVHIQKWGDHCEVLYQETKRSALPEDAPSLLPSSTPGHAGEEPANRAPTESPLCEMDPEMCNLV